ncbi:SDR family NAD(P)-dependent oxidoreductase [Gemmatirosa kalamazoonensis]|nr:SDR family NAD(P)-dependent oxidoreductase [Gemmatirosa kalamazoonensis]
MREVSAALHDVAEDAWNTLRGLDEAGADAVATMHGIVHLLVNNSVISVAGTVEDLPVARIEDAMAVNFWGVVHGCRAFLRHLRAAVRRGEPAAICNVLSDFALFALPTKAAYAASKHAARSVVDSTAEPPR